MTSPSSSQSSETDMGYGPGTEKAPGMRYRPLGISAEGYELYEVFIGPQHPASGHMRIVVKLDGDIIVEADPDIGYVHRTMEKLSETREYLKSIPLFERATIIDSANITWPYVRILEQMLGVEPPPRAEYLRTLLAEINRIASHLYGFGLAGIFINHSTMFMWSFGDREVWVQLAEELTGARLTHTYIIPGGVRRDLPQGFKEKALKAIRFMERKLEDYMKIFVYNPVTVARFRGVGVLSREDAKKLGIVGPNLRASGVKYDARIAEKYGAYPELDFEIPTREEGDSLARVLVRIEEIKQSMRIIRQVLEKMPQGPFFAEKYMRMIPPPLRKYMAETGRVKLPGAFIRLKPPAGEAVARGEMGHGEIFYHVVSTGETKPYRVRVVTPAFRNVVLFRHLTRGERFMDLPVIYGSIDYFPPEGDR